jgi:hypothetical protein
MFSEISPVVQLAAGCAVMLLLVVRFLIAKDAGLLLAALILGVSVALGFHLEMEVLVLAGLLVAASVWFFGTAH